MPGYDDPNDEGNSEKYHTGKLCIECGKRPAGTAWSPYFCFECNVKRIKRIDEQLKQIKKKLLYGGEIMIDISKIKVGDKVHYIPFDGCDDSRIENGIVKEMPGYTQTAIRVVFKCAGEWDRFMDYTSELTPKENLGYGWKNAEYEIR